MKTKLRKELIPELPELTKMLGAQSMGASGWGCRGLVKEVSNNRNTNPQIYITKLQKKIAKK